MQKRLHQITSAYNSLNSLSKNKALSSNHLDQILEMKKFYYHNLKGLQKQTKKETLKMNNIDIEKIALELVDSLPYELEAVLYDSGVIAYLSQGGMTPLEFNFEVKRIGVYNLSRDHWNDFFNDYECDFDYITLELKEDLIEHFTQQIEHDIEMFLAAKQYD